MIACKQDKQTIKFGYGYFGLEEGNFVEYDVMEIFHDIALNPAHDTVRYILKTVIGEQVEDNQGRMANKVFRFRFHPTSGALLDQRVWTAIIDGGRGEQTEENQRTIRLVFAVTNDKEWDINAYNTLDEQEAYYRDLNKEKTFNQFYFDSTVVVEYEDFFSLADYVRKYDTYANHVGLVQRSYKDLTISNFDTLNIKKGTEMHYSLRNYGKE
jgi:response regulator RpfG family c-di-GMP phosphodiesterase